MADAYYDDTGWRKLLKSVNGLDRYAVRVGILESSGGETEEGSGYTLLEIAALHEFGGENVPERSFIRRTFAEKHSELVAITGKLCKEVITRGMPVPRAYALLGQWGAAAVRATITQGQGVPPPNAPSTIEQKGSDRPLVDTGRLVGAIAYEVVEESSSDVGEDAIANDGASDYEGGGA